MMELGLDLPLSWNSISENIMKAAAIMPYSIDNMTYMKVNFSPLKRNQRYYYRHFYI